MLLLDGMVTGPVEIIVSSQDDAAEALVGYGYVVNLVPLDNEKLLTEKVHWLLGSHYKSKS
jgi:hypothetical protein